MDKVKLSHLVGVCVILLFGGCGRERDASNSDVKEGDFWKSQALNEIIIPWTEYAYDADTGSFPSYMDREWQPFQGDSQFPGMVSRHIFSYSTAYLLTGEDRYLEIAEGIVDDLLENGWDSEYGLWFNELDMQGEPVDSQKDMFMQLYAVTGLSMYYVVTRDKRVLNNLEKSIELLNRHAWDAENGGYVNILARDLMVEDDTKKATPQLASLSGYLAYLYPVTQSTRYLDEQVRGIELMLDKMRAPEQGWLLESFDRQWQLNGERSNRINVGHNLELVWLLLRVHLLTGKDRYRERAMELYTPLYEVAFNRETGAWHHSFLRDSNKKRASTSWWIQAYGNMLELYMYRITGDRNHLQNFQKGADFWNDHIMDKEFGGAFLKVGVEGRLVEGNKAVRSKTSYHSMEHGLLNYLYLNFWVAEQPVTLYFKVDGPTKGGRLYPNITEDSEVYINSVRIDGEIWDQFNAEEGFITLPPGNKKIEVELMR
ncbi:AGE family epimerase/isomerase [Fodinibius sediminis]|uniref:Mannose or cellobiose epimerase, N-acyl-D-glucosamine 2-epimerase family n=1 Tax=Fodinibius sediminis TaxID=1214077 RepID=A0A521DHZ8_9BACT|nr:AGE family epimerase/isomerase [Fodinibius sediminis]SMO71276.1 Mannose or cellobiose epimerase, N-acyl-D-glucosamine 2-epimerase family [Fodinibius sediminis]